MDFSKSEQYTLSIRLSADGFSFSVFNPLVEGEFYFFDRQVEETLSLTANLKQTFREIEWLNYSYRRVNVLIAGKRFTLVPLEFFEDEQTELLFYHNHSKRENETVQYNILRRNNVVVLFSMDKSARTFLCEQYPDVRFYSQASPFIESFSGKSRLGNNRKMYVHLRKDAADLYCYDRGRCCLPTLSNADIRQTASIICCISGSSSAWSRSATSCISRATCPTKKPYSANCKNSSGRYSSCPLPLIRTSTYKPS